MKQEQKAIVSPNVVVAVGYGACLDIFVDASDLLGKETPPILPSHASEIKTKKDLLETFAYFFSHGAAAEYVNSYKLSSFYTNRFGSIELYRIFLIRRFVASDSNDENMFDILVEKAKSSPSYRMALGGNAPVSNEKIMLFKIEN